MIINLEERVDNGIKFMDDLLKGWENRVNLLFLDQFYPDTCVIGQCLGEGGFWQQHDRLGSEDMTDMGFYTISEEVNKELNEIWREKIKEKRQPKINFIQSCTADAL